MQAKKILALLLALVMVFGIMSGCGTDATAPASSEAAASESVSATETETAPEAEVEAAPEAEGSVVEETETVDSPTGGLVLPLVDEPVTLTEWFGEFDAEEVGLSSPGDVLVSKALEEKTGVHIDYIFFSNTAVTEAASIMYASGDYCDMIGGGTVSYPGGFEKGVEDGVYLELNEFFDEGYAPNYTKLMADDPTVAKDAATDTGKYVAFWQVSETAQGPWFGTLIRQDWLDELDMEMPNTYDELHDVLVGFKSEMGAEYPLEPGASGYGWMNNFLAGCNVTSSWMQVDGEVKYGPVEDGYRSYLEYLSTWYEEGLVNPDFMSVGLMDNANVMSGQAGVFAFSYLACDSYSAQIEGARVVGMPEPLLTEDTVRHVGQVNGRVSTKWVTVSTACQDPELAIQWLDYSYSDEGMIVCNYGIENESFVYDENGKPQLTEMITNDPDYPFATALRRYLMGGSGVCRYAWDRELRVAGADSVACYDTWAHDGAYMISDMVSLTAEESEEQMSIMGDITTYVNEMTLKFITGQESLDNWDEYCDYIWGLGLEDAIALEQAALDRYNNR